MAYIKLDLHQFLVKSSDGFDCVNRPKTDDNFRMSVADASIGSGLTKNRIAYTKEKHRAKRTITQQLTPTGKPSKKPPLVTNIPGHVRWKIYAIPQVVVKMIEKQGQKIVQHNNHFSIETN